MWTLRCTNIKCSGCFGWMTINIALLLLSPSPQSCLSSQLLKCDCWFVYCMYGSHGMMWSYSVVSMVCHVLIGICGFFRCLLNCGRMNWRIRKKINKLVELCFLDKLSKFYLEVNIMEKNMQQLPAHVQLFYLTQIVIQLHCDI